MKKTEKDKLKNAFNIPEPVHKEKFISKYGDMLKKNEHKLRFSMIVKYSACTAFAVLIIGVWGIMNVNPDFADKFRGDNIVESAVTTSAGTSTNTVNMTSVVTNTVSTESNKINHITSSPTDSVTGSVSLQTTSVVSSVNSSTGKISTSKTQTTKKDTPAPNNSVTSTDLNAPPPEIIPEQTKSTGKTSNTNTSYHTTKTFQAVSTTKITEPKTTSQQSATVSTTKYIDNPPAVVPQPTQTNPEQNVTTTPVEDVVPPVCADPVGNFAVPPVTYQKDENAVYVYDIFRAGGSPGNISPSEPSDNASNDTQSIICAEIVDVIYTQFNNKPYTQLNLLVKYPLSGNIREYSKISLYVRGGYMPASEYAELNGFNYEHNTDSETIIYDYGESEKIFDISDVGSEYIFLIRYDSRNLPENVYMTVTDSDKSIISPDDFQS